MVNYPQFLVISYVRGKGGNMPIAGNFMAGIITFVAAGIWFIYCGKYLAKKTAGSSIMALLVALCLMMLGIISVNELSLGNPAKADFIVGVPYCTKWSAGVGKSQRCVFQNMENGREYFMAGTTEEKSLPATGCFVKTTAGDFLPVAQPGHPIPPEQEPKK